MTAATAYLLPGGGRRVALRMLMPMVREGAAQTWIHVAFEGGWQGHRDGEFEFTAKTFRQVVANFEANPNPVPMDYEHSIEFATHAPASGWVQKLEVREEDGKAHLWAFCELTDRAAEHVRAGEYRFCSGVFDFGATDLVTGEDIGCSMSSLALVNTPFIRGQQPIRLSQRAARALGDSMKKSQVLALMAIKKESLLAALDQIEGDEVSPEQLEAAAHFAAAKDGEMEEPEEAPLADLPEEPEEEAAPGLADEPAEEEPEPALADGELPMPDEEEDAAMAVLAPLMESTGLDLAALKAALGTNLDAVTAALTGALDQPAAPAPLTDDVASLQLSTAQGHVKSLSATNEKLTKELAAFREEEADRLVKSLADSGKILVGDSPKWRKMCLSQRDTFDAVTSMLPQVVPMGSHASAITPPPADSGPPIDESLPYVVLTRRNLSGAGIKDRATQDRKIREGLVKLSARQA